MSSDRFSMKTFFTTIISMIAVISAVITIYVFFFQQPLTDLQLQIVGNSKVYDINAESSKIDIYFDKKILNKEKDNLRIINIKVVNTGTESILKNHYDNLAQVGIKLSNAELVEKPEIVKTSSEYLDKNLRVTTDSLGTILFSQVIIEPEEFYILKLLLKHPVDSLLKVEPIGKIANIKEIKVIDNTIEEEPVERKATFMGDVLQGSFFIQLVRILIYGLGTLLVLGILVAIFGNNDSD